MGCCLSSPQQPENPNDHHDAPGTNVNPPHNPPPQPPAGGTEPSQPPAEGTAPSQPPVEGTTPFAQYTLAELMAATDGFSLQNMLSKGGDELRNFIYRGRLHGRQQIAVKRFSIIGWPDAEEFREEAIRVGRLRHRRVANLIGYCCEGDERILVAEFMPNDTLAMHLFNHKITTMEWSMRLRVACYIAEALEYCCNEGQALYYNLNAYKVLFDEGGNPFLSCFGLVKIDGDARCYSYNNVCIPPECGDVMATIENMILSFGFLLRDLLSGEKTEQSKVQDVIEGKNIPIDLDPLLIGKHSKEESDVLIRLASQCLQYRAENEPTINDIIVTLAQVQSNSAGPSNAR